MTASLTSALSSMEVMLDALMQRGIGKPEEQNKPKEEQEPPALPTRPTVRGRPPSWQKPGAVALFIQRSQHPSLPPTQEGEGEKSSVNVELEQRAVKAEEEAKQKDEAMRQKDEEIAALQQQVEHYQSRLSECESRMKSVEEELQKQIASLQMAQTAGMRRGGSRMTSQSRHELSGGSALPSFQAPPARKAEEAPPPTTTTRQERDCEPAVAANERQTTEVDKLAKDFQRERDAFENKARVAAAEAAAPPPVGGKSVDELKALERQYGAWKKDYEARLRKTKAELKKLVHAEKAQGGHGHGHQRRCAWWRLKVPKCRAPKCCSFRLPSPKSCCCCFRRCC
ncbi:hypothetical protein ACP70R_000138 [Stipagrostis hirtigluma subsp. patula]